MKSYNQYCPLAHALDVVGERWSLLIVRELFEHDQMRYSDLHANLAGCGTNILASRLKELERHGVVTRRRLPPPAASTVYELTEYGEALRPVMHELAHWGARSLGPPSATEDLQSGWLKGALEIAFPLSPTEADIEFRIGDEIASFADGDVIAGGCESRTRSSKAILPRSTASSSTTTSRADRQGDDGAGAHPARDAAGRLSGGGRAQPRADSCREPRRRARS